MTVARTLPVVALLALWGPTTTLADQPARPAAKASYARDVLPLFQQHCLGCHQPARPQGGYVMTSRERMLEPGTSGEVGVVPGKPEQSKLFTQLLPEGKNPPKMPKNKPAFTAQQVELVKNWIAQGAVDDSPPSSSAKIDEKNPPVYALPPVIPSIDYSPDGHLLAVAGYHEVLVYNCDGSTLVARLVGLAERVQSVAFSPDGKRLAVAGGSPARFGEIQIWDVAKKKLLLSHMVTGDTLYGVSWSPDGKLLAFGCSDKTLRAIEAATGKQVLYQGAHTDWVLGSVFSRDGDYLASISRDMTIKLTEVTTQRFIDNVTSITPGVLKGGIQAVSRRPIKTRTLVKVASIEIGDTREKAYDEVLIGGSDGQPRLYRMHRVSKRVIGDDANKLRSYESLPGRIFALKFSPDGSRFVVGASNDGKGEARVIDTDTAKRVCVLAGQKGAVYALTYSPDGKTIASAGFDGVVRLNDADTGKLIREFVAVPIAKKQTARVK